MFSSRKHSPLALGLAAVASIALLAGCAGSGDPEAEPETSGDPIAELEAAAFEEGQLTVYASAAESQIQALTDAFMDEYPEISVEYFRAAGAALFNRFETEADAGSMVADVFMPTIQPSFVADNAEWFTEITDELVPNSADWPDDFRTNLTLQLAVEEITVIYNTDNITDPPQEWEDVLNDDYKGRIILVDPAASPSYMSWYSIMLEAFGEDFLTGLAELDPIWVDTGAVGAQQVATGSYDLVIPTYPSHAVALIDQGAPLDLVRNLDPTQGITTSVAITADAPNPNAARLFANWLLSPAAFDIICADPVFTATIDGTDCQDLASNYVEPHWDVSQDEQAKIISLLGR